jgi:SH3-like domain-containing protein
VFALPLRLQTLGRSNVRDGPGTNYKVLFMLEVGSAVIAYAYADQWVRINDEGGRSGWVFYNLVGRRDGSP